MTTSRQYLLQLRDDAGCTHDVAIEAKSNETAIKKANDIAQTEADDWCSDGEWGDDGASVDVWWKLTDAEENEIDNSSLTVEIEPCHDSLISAATDEDICGDSPDDHDWTAEGEGGCTENPGVWSTGGTSMRFQTHCRKCGLHRTEYSTGSQRNLGEHDTVKYRMLDENEIDRHRENGTMDAAE